jgi:hypothetical protein
MSFTKYFVFFFSSLVLSTAVIGNNLKENTMSATGTFEVQLEPQQDEKAPSGRMLIDKTFAGDLVGTGKGQMISKRIEGGSAVYFAVEEVEGVINGKTGGFTLLHHGTMSAEGQSLSITIMQGSGRGELDSISGEMEIIQNEDGHRYVLSYSL